MNTVVILNEIRYSRNMHHRTESFFMTFQKANEAFDSNAIALCYSDPFLFGQPQGVQAIKKEDFLKVLPKRKEFIQSLGLKSSTVVSIEELEIDEQYMQVKVMWEMKYEKNNKSIKDVNTTTYILYKKDDRFEIVLQIDHQDLIKKAQALFA